MLGRQLSQASLWSKGPRCIFCVARSYLQPPHLQSYVTRAVLSSKRRPKGLHSTKARQRIALIKLLKAQEGAGKQEEATTKAEEQVDKQDAQAQVADEGAAEANQKKNKKEKPKKEKIKKEKPKEKPKKEKPKEKKPKEKKPKEKKPKEEQKPKGEKLKIRRVPDKPKNTAEEKDAKSRRKVPQKASSKKEGKDALEPLSLKEAMLGIEGTILGNEEAMLEEEEEASFGNRKVRSIPREPLDISVLFPDHLEFKPVEVDKPPVPMLSYGLDRVLFNPGIYHLQDPRSRVYNFDPYLEMIMPVSEFNFDALSEYKTSSKDTDLLSITQRTGAKFTGSTSSMSGVLQHFHYILSNFRELNHQMLSKGFPRPSEKFSKITLGPSAVFLRYKDGIYAIDADKSYDSPNIMSWLGHSLEKLLTTERSEFERFRISNTGKPPSEDNSSRCYHYSRQGNLLMRSQLDAHDPRLPGTGVFDLKTRAVVSIRMNHTKYEQGSGYQIRHAMGQWESFEREFYDMTRATLLKYSLQVRMGRMDGIFVAFHNIERIFGFQYLSLPDMDEVLHGQRDTHLGDQEFKLSIALVDELLSKATARFPNTSLRLHVEARQAKTPFMYVFAEPVTEEEADRIQTQGDAAQKEFAQTVVGVGRNNPEIQAAWQKTQDEVNRQLAKDQHDVSTAETPAAEAEAQNDDVDEVNEEIDQDDTTSVVYEGEVEEHNVTAEAIEAEVQQETEETEETEVQKETEAELQQEIDEAELQQETKNNKESEESEEDTMESIAKEAEEDPAPYGRPLIGWTLTIRSKVNQEYVSRPSFLTNQDEWNIEYYLQEIPADKCWDLYRSIKSRRRRLFDQSEQEDNKGLQAYRDLIQSYSDTGREWRNKEDEIKQRLGVTVYTPMGPGSATWDSAQNAPYSESSESSEAPIKQDSPSAPAPDSDDSDSKSH